MARLPKVDPTKVAERAMEKFMEDPLATVVQTDNYLDALTNFAPVMPWEFPIPVPRGIYNRLGLASLNLKPE